MKILIVDNNIDQNCWGASDLRQLALASAPGSTVYVRRAPHGDLPKNADGYDRVIVSGSKTSALEDAPWIDALLEFIRRTVDQRKPLLGVCYGHQSLVRALGGKQTVRKAEEAEIGWTQIEVLEDDPLLKGIPKSFYSFNAHYDEVATLPGALKRLARSSACELQAVRVRELPAFGIQFHPEKDAADAKKTFAETLKKSARQALLHPKESEKLYDPAIGKTLFTNFLAL